MTKETPIIFSTPMVQAILEGRKTMTRRILKVQPKDNQDWKLSTMMSSSSREDKKHEGKLHWVVYNNKFSIKEYDERYFLCPFGKVGDQLWVRECFQYKLNDKTMVAYRADVHESAATVISWKPSIFMPKAAARIWLEITNIKVERLNEITEEDALCEGVEFDDENKFWFDYSNPLSECYNPIQSFETLWMKINGEDAWDLNPWVWVIEFKRINK